MPTSTLRTAVALSAMFLVVAAGFAAIVGFFAIGNSVSRLDITSGAPTCTGSKVVGARGAIELRRGMRCTVAVTVVNSGRLEVSLGELVLPFMGTEGGPAVQVERWAGLEPEGTDIDAVFDLDTRLRPNEVWSTEITYTFRRDGCTGLGTFSANMVEVEASAWGRSARVPGGSLLFEGTSESEC